MIMDAAAEPGADTDIAAAHGDVDATWTFAICFVMLSVLMLMLDGGQ